VESEIGQVLHLKSEIENANWTGDVAEGPSISGFGFRMRCRLVQFQILLFLSAWFLKYVNALARRRLPATLPTPPRFRFRHFEPSASWSPLAILMASLRMPTAFRDRSGVTARPHTSKANLASRGDETRLVGAMCTAADSGARRKTRSVRRRALSFLHAAPAFGLLKRNDPPKSSASP
jgi:hypothetical protein